MVKKERRGEDGCKGRRRDALSEKGGSGGSGKASTPRVRACAERRSAAAR